jgi:hypothetical protein
MENRLALSRCAAVNNSLIGTLALLGALPTRGLAARLPQRAIWPLFGTLLNKQDRPRETSLRYRPLNRT